MAVVAAATAEVGRGSDPEPARGQVPGRATGPAPGASGGRAPVPRPGPPCGGRTCGPRGLPKGAEERGWRRFSTVAELAETIRRGYDRLLGARRDHLASGAAPVGWKLAGPVGGLRDLLEDGSLVFGHLCTASEVGPGGSYRYDGSGQLTAEAELAVRLRADLGPGDPPGRLEEVAEAVAVALELVDLAEVDREPEEILAGNVLHRAFCLGAPVPVPVGCEGAAVSLTRDGHELGTGRVPGDVPGRLRVVAGLMERVGVALAAGDWVLTGALIFGELASPGRVAAAISGVGEVALDVALVDGA